MAEILVTTNDFDLNTPVDGSDVIVVDDNSQAVDTGLNQAGDYYDSLTLAEGYEHDVGSSGSYLRCNSVIVRDLSGGSTWLQSDDNNGAGGEKMLDVLIHKMRNDNHAYLSSAATQHADSVWHRIYCKRGIVDIEAALEFDSSAELAIDFVDSRANDCVVNLIQESGAGNAVPNLTAQGGRIVSNRTITRGVIENAHLIQDTKPCTLLIIKEGGTAEYRYKANSDTSIIVMGGGHLIIAGLQRLKAFTRVVLLEGARITGWNADLHTGLVDLRQGAR